MSISKIRIGNQISLQWTIKQGDTAYDLSAKTNKVYLVAPMARYEVTNFTLSGDNHNIINITWRGVDQRYCGEYHLLLVSVGSNGENMFSLDSMPCFILTPVTDQSAASTATTVQLTDNIMMPSSGESLYEMMVRNGLFDGTEAEFLQEYEDKLDACETATDAANDAATDADTAAGNATTAAATANSAATNANTKAALANTKAQLAAEKAALADTAASNADSKADAAHTAAAEAAAAAELAETKAGLANSAASSANSAASSATSAASAATSAAQSATSAASTANTKAALAQTKADLANSAAQSATSAASSANSAASSANTAATGAANVNATLSGNNLTITDRDGNSTTVNTKGAKGDPGDVSQEEFTALALQVGANKSDIEAIPFSYMAGARVGTSDDLTPDNVATSETIKERIAGGSNTIKKGSALVERVKGNTAVWNQLVDSVINQSRTINGLSLVLSNGNLTITGTASQDTDLIIVDATNQVKGWVTGHKVISLLSSPINNSNLRDSYSWVVGSNTCIVYTSASIYYNLRVNVSAGTTLNYSGKLQLCDLTQMFGSGNEPTTLAEFNARCPKVANPYAYNAGTIVGMTAEGVQCTGVNLWDEEWEKGSLDWSTGANVASNTHIRSINHIPVISSTTYHIKANDSIEIVEYNKDKSFVRNLGAFRNASFTLSSETNYIRIVALNSSTYNHDICINISNASINGQYFPYVKPSARTWGNILTSAFGGTMHAVGSVYDEIGLRKAVKRFGVVKLKDLNWYSTGSYVFFNATAPSDLKYPSSNLVKANIYTNLRLTPMSSGNAEITDKSIGVTTAGTIRLRDESFANVSSFIASLTDNDILVYELATPTETTYDELAMTYKATPNGMESMVAENASAPLKADIVYPINAQGSIRNNSTAIGTLANLATTAKTDLVSAINELYNMIANG